MNLLQQIEQHIIDGKDEQFIINCLQAVGIKFFEAVDSNLFHIVGFMIKYGVDIHAHNDWALKLASERGRIEVVKLLLAAGADVHVTNNLPLRWASQNGHSEVVKLLIAAGANADDAWALQMASRNGHSEVVKLLKEAIENELLTTN